MGETRTSFGAVLCRLRVAAGLTQEELAERAGLSRHGISDLERGARHAPRLETVRMLADALALEEPDRQALLAAARPTLLGNSAPIAAPAVPLLVLPAPLTRLIGREAEITALRTLLVGDQAHLVTITGPGGVGKTRLALAVAAQLGEAFPDGRIFVDLASIRDPTLVLSTITRTLGLHESGDSSVQDTLPSFLATKRLLLVLDNYEHLLEAAPVVSDLLQAGPGTAVLVTSREPLRLRGEREVAVAPLPLPDLQRQASRTVMTQNPAVALFVQRAQDARADFVLTDENAANIAAICTRLDGLPLAVELAAARTKVLPPAALLSRLATRLPLLTGGSRDAPARQRTMRDAIAWSYDLLPAQNKALFRRLATFDGGFTLELADSVCANDGDPGDPIFDGALALVDASLLRCEDGTDDEPRFSMLETIREYALERLKSEEEAEQTRQRHAEVFLRLGAMLAEQLEGFAMAESLARLTTELPNLRAAIAWSMEEGRDADAGLRLVTALSPFWRFRGHLREGRRWLDAGLAAGSIQMTTRIDGLVAAAELAIFQGEYATARAFGDAALEFAALHRHSAGAARAVFMLAIAADFQGDLGRALPLYEQAMTRKDALAAPDASRLLACVAGSRQIQGDLDQAETLASEALALAREAGHAWSAVLALGVLAHVAVDRSAYAEGLRLGQECFAVAQAIGAKLGMAGALGTLGGVFLSVGQPERATHLLAAGRALVDAIGVVPVANNDYFERVLAAARDSLDEQAFGSAWAAGWTLSPEEALVEVLVEPELFARPRRGESA